MTSKANKTGIFNRDNCMFRCCSFRRLSTPPTFKMDPTIPLSKSESVRDPLLGPVRSSPPTYCESCPIFSVNVIFFMRFLTNNVSLSDERTDFFTGFCGKSGVMSCALPTKRLPMTKERAIIQRFIYLEIECLLRCYTKSLGL